MIKIKKGDIIIEVDTKEEMETALKAVQDKKAEKKEETKEQEIKTDTKYVPRKRAIRGKYFSKEQRETILTEWDKGQPLKHCLIKALGYSDGHTSKRAQRLLKKSGREYGIRRAKIKEKPERTKTKRPDQTERWRRMNERANQLMKQYPTWGRQKAYIQAAQEINQHKGLGTITEKQMPRIISDDGKNKILIDILKTASQTGRPINRQLEGCAIDQYSSEEWRNLCTKIMNKTAEVCHYLGVENHFKIRFMGTTPYIIYTK